MALTEGLVSYWKLDGNSNDSIGSNNGTDSSISYGSSFGKINQGASFNRTSSSINVGNLLSNYSAVTVAAWFNTGALGAYRNIFRKTDGTYNQFLRITDTNKLQGAISTTIDSYPTGNTMLSSGTWYYAVLTYDGSFINMYLNAATDCAAIAKSGNLKTASSNVFLGKEGQSGTEFWSGYIDEIGVWNRALTATEISQLYAAGNGLTYPFLPTNIKFRPGSLGSMLGV